MIVAALVFILQDLGRSRDRRRDRAERKEEREADREERRAERKLEREEREQDRRERQSVVRREQSERSRRGMESRMQESSARRVRISGLLIALWPLAIQTRGRMAHVLANLGSGAKGKFDAYLPLTKNGGYYTHFEVGLPPEWSRVESELWLLGPDVAIALAEMLAILRQFDADIVRLQRGGEPVNYQMYIDFILGAKAHADTAILALENVYQTHMRRKPRRSLYYAISASADAAARRARTIRMAENAPAPNIEAPVAGAS